MLRNSPNPRLDHLIASAPAQPWGKGEQQGGFESGDRSVPWASPHLPGTVDFPDVNSPKNKAPKCLAWVSHLWTDDWLEVEVQSGHCVGLPSWSMGGLGMFW